MYESVALLIILVIVIITYIKTGKKNYPPGPPSWIPVIGHRLLTKRLAKEHGSFEAALRHLRSTYNSNVIGLNLSGNYTVIVFTEPLIRKVLLAKEFQSRPRNFFNTLRSLGTNKGITMTDGQLWHEQRSFLVKHLSELGFGGTVMDRLIEDEFKSFLKDIGDGGDNIEISSLLAYRTINVIWKIVAGEHISTTKTLTNLLKLMSIRSVAFDIGGGSLAQMPWLRYIAPQSSGYNLIVKLNKELKDIIMESIIEHKKSYKKGITRDFIDAFLHEMYSNDGNENSTFDNDQLLMVCLDLFIAGLNTTTHTVEFSILRMMKHPEVQEKVQKEIDLVLQRDKIPSFQDRSSLPYTWATITEVLRSNYVVPLTGPRKALTDTSLDGYFIPKGTTMITHVMSLMTDESKFEDPHSFKPERFLSKTDQNEQFYPFSYGKRRCPGEVLGRSILFVFFAGILQKFKIMPPSKGETPSLKPIPGILNAPRPYKIGLIPRNNNDTINSKPYY